MSAAGRRPIGRSPTGRSVRTDSTSAPAHHRDVPARGPVRVRCGTSHRHHRPARGTAHARSAGGSTARPGRVDTAPGSAPPGIPDPVATDGADARCGCHLAVCGVRIVLVTASRGAARPPTTGHDVPDTVSSPRWQTPATARAPTTGNPLPRGPDIRRCRAPRVERWPSSGPAKYRPTPAT